MRKVLFVAAVLAVTAAQAQTKKEAIKVNFPTEINGFKISAYWVPATVYGTKVEGPAILELYNSQTMRTSFATSNHFAVDKADLPAKMVDGNSDQINYNGGEITLKRNTTNGEDDRFFRFMDLNMDGNKDLVVTEYYAGQRGVPNYKVYTISDGGIDPFDNPKSEAPFNRLDGLSEIDLKKQTITIYSSGGVGNNSSETYKYSPNLGRYEMVSMWEDSTDPKTNKVRTTTYSVKNGVKKVVSQK